MAALQTESTDEIPDPDNKSLTGSTSKNPMKKRIKMEWSPENEKILVEWCDIAQCYKWLNTKAHSRYSVLHARFTIPAITLSTISGTASFAQASLPLEYQVYAPMVIGTINIAIGILTTIQQYLKISELNESHRVAAIAWDKYARNIRIELAKAPKERLDADIFIKHNRDEFDRLMETSPTIPPQIIELFMKTFQGDDRDYAKKSRFEALKKPDICDIIVSAEENRHHWYKEIGRHLETDDVHVSIPVSDLEHRVENDILKREEELRKKEQDVHDKELEIAAREKRAQEEQLQRDLEEHRRLEEIAQEKVRQAQMAEARLKQQLKKIDEYVALFTNTHGRRPLGDEIADHFKTSMDAIVLGQYLQSYVNDLV